MTFSDFTDLPVELRLHLLGLPVRRGRPRALNFRERVRVAQAHAEALARIMVRQLVERLG